MRSLLQFIKQYLIRLVEKTEKSQTDILNGNTDIPIYRKAENRTAFRYSEILTNVCERRANLESLNTNNVRIDIRTHPYAIVLSPDCDLDWDFKSRFNEGGTPNALETFYGKELPTILLCEVVEARSLRDTRNDLNAKAWAVVKKNKNERYHFFSIIQPEHDLHDEGLPELAIDFKRYFTIPTAELYWQAESGECKRHTWLSCSYLEHLGHRFGNFISRVALPHDYESL